MSNDPQTDRIGVHMLGVLFSQVGWLYREQPICDVGIDAQVEIVKDNKPTGQLLALQIKSGMSYFSEQKNNEVVYRPDKKHVNYWLQHSLPVLIVLYNTETKQFVWTYVDLEEIVELEKACKICIPLTNILTEENVFALEKISRGPTHYFKLNRLLLDRELIKLVNDGEDVFIEYEDWVNKSLSRTSPELIYFDKGNEVRVNIPTIYCPGLSPIDIAQYTFPWADFEMDIESYREEKENEFEYSGLYDSEDDTYYQSCSFNEWYEEPEGIVPIRSDVGGEIDVYRVKLKLNEMGNAFIKIFDYLYDISLYDVFSFSVDDI